MAINEEKLDQRALDQALRDVDVANARALDLSERLVSLSSELTEARRQLDELRHQHDALRSEHEQMQGSAAFRIASKIWALRNALRA